MNLRQFSLHRRAVVVYGLTFFLMLAGLSLVTRNPDTLLRHLSPTTTIPNTKPSTGSAGAWPSPNPTPLTSRPLSLPEADQFPLENNQAPSFCADRFSVRYLDYLQEHSIQYCSPGSATNLTCFHSHTQQDNNHDSLCIGQDAVLQSSGKFELGCKIRTPDESETGRGLIRFDKIRSYWYDTGPGYVFSNFVKLSDSFTPPAAPDKTRRFVLLVKREGAGHVWHNLMEIWSMAHTFDTLRLAPDARGGDGAMFRYPEDVPNTQVIILDDHDDGPVFDLWTLFAGRKPLRLKDILADKAQQNYFETHPHDMIVPLAGASNPLWQNDWEERDCQQATLLKIFIRRVMKHYNLEYRTVADVAANRKDKGIRLTFIDRKGSRKLLDNAKLLDAVRAKYDNVIVDSVDFATISFQEQLRLVQQTDILVGVHGAGLTHTMFMPEGAGAVVEILPDGMNYRGFRNLAVMTGHRYFSTHGELVTPPGKTGRSEPENSLQTRSNIKKRDKWHWADVQLGEEAFLKLIDDAVESLYKAQQSLRQ